MDHLKKIELLYNVSENSVYGFSENEIIEIENKLKIKLPKILREYYLKLGNNIVINGGWLLELYQIKFIDSGNYWAINKGDLESENPKVYESHNINALTQDWFIGSETMECFLLSMTYLNGVFHGLNFTWSYIKRKGVKRDVIENSFTEIKELKKTIPVFFK